MSMEASVCRVSAGHAGGVCRYWPAQSCGVYPSFRSAVARELEKKGSEVIEHYLREGQHIIVQVVKDPLGSKGARLTTEISIPSRYQVYMPYANNSGVSQRIQCEAERARLRASLILQAATSLRRFYRQNSGRMRGRIDSDSRYDVLAQIVGIHLGKDCRRPT